MVRLIIGAIYWIWTIIEVSSAGNDELKKYQKSFWLILVIAIPMFGALLYHLVHQRQKKNRNLIKHLNPLIMSQELSSYDAVKKFKDLVESVNICMFTTIDDSNNIFSRPMSTVKIDDDGNAWFFTNEYSEKIQEVSRDNCVTLIYAHPGKNVYVSVKGSCTII